MATKKKVEHELRSTTIKTFKDAIDCAAQCSKNRTTTSIADAAQAMVLLEQMKDHIELLMAPLTLKLESITLSDLEAEAGGANPVIVTTIKQKDATTGVTNVIETRKPMTEVSETTWIRDRKALLNDLLSVAQETGIVYTSTKNNIISENALAKMEASGNLTAVLVAHPELKKALSKQTTTVVKCSRSSTKRSQIAAAATAATPTTAVTAVGAGSNND